MNNHEVILTMILPDDSIDSSIWLIAATGEPPEIASGGQPADQNQEQERRAGPSRHLREGESSNQHCRCKRARRITRNGCSVGILENVDKNRTDDPGCQA